MNNPNSEHHETLKQMLQMIVPQTGYAALADESGVRACGLGVVQQGYVGLFDIFVKADARRWGYGKQIVTQLLLWGKAHGARTAYLQVMRQNTPALNLYAKLGFREQYEYWYRVGN